MRRSPVLRWLRERASHDWLLTHLITLIIQTGISSDGTLATLVTHQFLRAFSSRISSVPCTQDTRRERKTRKVQHARPKLDMRRELRDAIKKLKHGKEGEAACECFLSLSYASAGCHSICLFGEYFSKNRNVARCAYLLYMHCQSL